MLCEDVQRELAENLEQAAESVVAAHLADCAACQAGLAQLRAVVDAVQRLPQPPVPAGLRERTLSAVARAKGRRRSILPRAAWRLAAVGAAAAVVVWVGQPHGSGVLEMDRQALHPDAYVSSHALLTATGPLADGSALLAMGALADRAERRP